MSGTIVITTSDSIAPGWGTALQRATVEVSIDGSVRASSFGLPAKVRVAPGAHSVEVSIDGFITDEVAVAVRENGRHVVTVKQSKLAGFSRSVFGVLLAGAVPGLRWYAEYADTTAPEATPALDGQGA